MYYINDVFYGVCDFMCETRLQKFLAEAGIASRRKAEQIIRQGRVTVNGFKVTEMGMKVTNDDVVEVDNKPVNHRQNKIYIMLNKPTGYVTTVEDELSRNTVLDLISGIKERIYPVGRLDFDTSGLLLLTNDGDFTFRLTHPRHHTQKVYIAEIEGIPGPQEIKRFKEGIILEDFTTSPADIKILKKRKGVCTVEITIYEGRNRQIRRMCEEIGHMVISLKRIAIGSIQLGDLQEGKWRYLHESEVITL